MSLILYYYLVSWLGYYGIILSQKDMHKECQCGSPAVWESVPCNAEDHKDCTSHHVWCVKCVPRNCTFCNEMEPDPGKWQPCIEIAPIENDMEETLNIHVKTCQRCGEDHNVEFRPLANPAYTYTYWGMCSNINQPLLLRIREIQTI
jgi:transcription elongation factor Elf1